MTRATEDILDSLHGTLAQSLIDEIQAYKQKGEPVPPALLGQAIKFLKDNGVNAPVKPGSVLETLGEELDDVDLEDASMYH